MGFSVWTFYTQRSESMNFVLKRYVSYKNKFLEFFNRFDRLIADRRYEELKADFKANISVPSLSFTCELLKHSARVYTPEVHSWFQAEFGKSQDATCVDSGDLGTIRKYIVTHYKKYFHHTVMHDELSGTFTCSCRKFEFAGILCSHILKLVSMKTIVRIPDKYILKRWTCKAKTHIEVDGVVNAKGLDPDALYTLRCKDLCHLYVELATKAGETEETYLCARNELLQMVGKVDAALQVYVLNEKGKEKEVEDEPTKESCLEPQEKPTVKIKGIKTKKKTTSGNRMKRPLEKSTKKKKYTHMTQKNSPSMPSGSSPMNSCSMPSESLEIPIQLSQEISNPSRGQPVYMPSSSQANIQHIAAMQQIPSQLCAQYMINPSQLQAFWSTQSSQVHATHSGLTLGYGCQNANGSNTRICKCQLPCSTGMFCRFSGRIM